MKKGLAIVLILAMLLCSCNDAYCEEIITDIKQYDTIWELPEKRIGTYYNRYSHLFPTTVEEAEVSSFRCIHSTYHIVGTGWQVELILKYDDNKFYDEVNRIKELCVGSPVYGESTYFDLPAYASAWKESDCFEYACVDEENKTIGYIYLQLIREEKLEINSTYIPHPYEYTNSDDAYSIYYQQ